jgi:hypothetical protein
MREKSFFCVFEAAARVEWTENIPYICCFNLANVMLNKINLNEEVLPFAKFEHVYMEV